MRKTTQTPMAEGISTIAKACEYLEKTCLPKMNRIFSRLAAKPGDAHTSGKCVS
jgi:hypothetical protein